jgi:ATP-binding protein involved in chromosome partitioning
MGYDPRYAVIDRRLERVGRIVAVSSGKGGVGKSLIASVMSLALASTAKRVGLFDLDFAGSSAHVVLGAEGLYPVEDKGILPPSIHGVDFMSVVHYVGETAAPMRGEDVCNTITELLAITRWERLDVLIVDMPPGLGDATMDTIRLLPRAEFLAVTTASKMAMPVVTRVLHMLKEMKVPILGVVENMASRTDATDPPASVADIPLLGSIPYDPGLEAALGCPERLLATDFGIAVKALAERAGL